MSFDMKTDYTQSTQSSPQASFCPAFNASFSSKTINTPFSLLPILGLSLIIVRLAH